MDKKPEKFGKRHLPVLSFWACWYLLRLFLDRRFGNIVLAPKAGVRGRVLTAYMLAGMRLTSREALAILLADDAACGLLRLQVVQFMADWKMRAKAQHAKKA